MPLADVGAKDAGSLTAAAGRLWFAAHEAGDAADRWWLWSSDGTTAGTRRLPFEISRGLYNSPYGLPIVALGDAVYFALSDPPRGRELWRSDGTVEGTAPVVDLTLGLASAPTSNLVAWRDRIWFAAVDGVHGDELWSTDGTAAGTRLELDLDPGPVSSWPDRFTVAGDHLFFVADDGTSGWQLWATD